MKSNQNKPIEAFNKLSDQARYGILAGIVLLIIALDVGFLVIPQLTSISGINDQINKLSSDTQQVLTDRTRLTVFKKNLQQQREQLELISDRIRPIQEMPAIMSTMSSIANEFGVKIDELTPQKEKEVALNSSPDGKYYAVPVVVKARGGYHMFGHFLNKLENQDLYFFVQDFIIQNDDKDVSNHLYSMTIKLVLIDKH